ncbi:tyrosine-type recombinase/integrase [Demequina sp. NBRC 110055]|uniref:tyrosine-type recombinase/integrase n=1 Tax=Demequina sp. NBRC 110055 TaxID=1570344 RepID=UPI000A0572AF|nr:tyrosine-type recombinase/integrase [Demequina sp. NBRC 110055]
MSTSKTTLPEGIRKLPSGRFQARYKAPDGTRRTLGSYATVKEAQKELILKEAEIEQSRWIDDRKADVAFGEFAWDVFGHKERTLKASTVTAHRSLLNRELLPVFGTMKLKDVTPYEVEKWWGSRKDKPVSKHHAYSLLNNYMNTAVRWGYLASNPCLVRGALKDPSEPRPVWGVPDFQKVYGYCTDQMATMLIVAFSGHLRAGELLGLNRGDFDPETGVLTVSRAVSKQAGLTTPKNGETKRVTLLQQGRDALDAHLRGRAMDMDAPMFTGPRGGRVKYAELRAGWVKGCEAAGLENFHFHDIRHVSLTHIAHTGASLREIMARGGHKSVQAAMRYQSATGQRDSEIAALASAGFIR